MRDLATKRIPAHIPSLFITLLTTVTVTTTGAAAARRVTYQLETLWDYDYVPTHDELATADPERIIGLLRPCVLGLAGR